jgi:multidrug efflux system membrane fusion protein
VNPSQGTAGAGDASRSHVQMSRRKALFGLLIVAAIGAAWWHAGSLRGLLEETAAAAEKASQLARSEEAAAWFPPLKWLASDKAAAPSPRPQRAVAVEVATAVKKRTPVIIEGLGNVTTIANVAIRPRIDSEIVGVHFADGAIVKKGDLLITLDSRAIEAQIAQAEGNIARDQAQLEGAERDFRRYTDLVGKQATPVVNVENAKTQIDTFRAAVQADKAALDNLKVQLSYCRVTAPIGGRISQANVKVGNFARAADTMPIATINQMAPIYVTFTVPQRNLPELRVAMAETGASVEAIIPGDKRRARGTITMVENTIDPTTGMATLRATMPNDDELLWPGTLVTAQVTLRSEEAVVVPSPAVQVSQQGNFVFVVKDNVAVVTPVTVARSLGSETVIQSGLNAGDVVVTDGHLLLTDKARVTVRQRKAGV